MVCGASLDGDDTEKPVKSESEELVTWYYYDLGGGSGYLDTVYTEDDEHSKLVYTFQAPPEDENGDCDAAKEVLRREYKPDAFMESETSKVNTKPDPVVRCPRCGSTSIQLIPKRWSPLTGFRTNSVIRCCVNCKHRW